MELSLSVAILGEKFEKEEKGSKMGFISSSDEKSRKSKKRAEARWSWHTTCGTNTAIQKSGVILSVT